jgi:pimeloyl-ACP methyl ester carboxylesterase
LKIAAKHKICLGVEPETANVINSARKARRLLDELQSPHLKIVMDASNLFHFGDGVKKEDVLTEAFDLLGGDIALAHAKDFRETDKMEFLAPGKGSLPWGHYIRLLRASGFTGPLVMHSLPEADVDGSTAFLRKTMIDVEHPTRLPISSEFFRDGITFHYQDAGRGIPFFYQHGLGGSVEQPFGLFQPPAGFRMISFDCRGHGQTRPIGPAEKLSVSTFADDLLALMDQLRIPRAIIGGISMGAALALNFTIRNPERVRALILQRPAWLDCPRHDNVGVYPYMAQLIRELGPEKGLEIFKASPQFQKIFKESPLGAKSLIGHFLDPRAVETVDLLERIPLDSPHPDRARWRAINVPTLVLANRQDHVHPYDFGLKMAKEIPGAEFHELTPKAVSLEKHNAEVRQFLEAFLLHHF